MTVTHLLRATAIVMACVGVIDPSWQATRRAPIPVALHLTSGADGPAAEDVRRRLTARLSDAVSFAAADDPAAVVLIGAPAQASAITDGAIPVSTVALTTSLSPNVRIVAATSPAPVPTGWAATFTASIEARGMTGKTSRIVLEQQGAEIARVDHAWTRDPELFDAALVHAPPVEGAAHVTLRVVPLDGEVRSDDNAADLRLVATARRLKVLAHEPRPSWAAAFVRREIEADAAFDVSTLVEASRGLEVRAGDPPPSLTAAALSPYDVVLVGAPEELTASDVEALRGFAYRRGGTVVLLPDRRPSGRYPQLLPGLLLDELLVERPLDVRGRDGAMLHASELAVPRPGTPSGDLLASIDRSKGDEGKGTQPVVVALPAGSGRVIFSGALDAWRFRATPDQGFGRFWRALLAEAALAAPPRIALSLEPALAKPGDALTIRAQLRGTEFDDAAMPVRVPAVKARVIGARGGEEAVRLWPVSEPGAFEGTITAPSSPGPYDLQVSTDAGASADTVLTVVAGAQHPAGRVEDAREGLQAIAAATGGVAVDAADLAPLERFLRALPGPDVARAQHPARSPWFVIAFALLACAEWALRRRRGLV